VPYVLSNDAQVNPFQRLPHLYDHHMMDQYRGHELGELSPHVFAIAESSFEAMRKENASQSILVSGESGAGKTETAKQIMHYLAHMGGRAGDGDGAATTDGDEVRREVLARWSRRCSSPTPCSRRSGTRRPFVTTTRRDSGSSSRSSSTRTTPSAARRSARTCWSGRASSPIDDPERNFHVFYQLCDGADDAEKRALRLKASTEFAYLSASSCHTLGGVDNADEYRATRRAMDVVGIERAEQDAVMRVVAGVLHLGNVTFAAGDDDAADDGCVLAGDAARAALADAAAVLRVDAARLEKALRTRVIETRDGAIEKPLDVKAATDARDSLAKTTYARLFDWLVRKINRSIGQDASSERFIGVLDIYGFESFKTNSFEQFCINLANEKLQQHFNQHVFKSEQEEYEREAIDWSYIEFVDNQDVLDLIEKRPTGIISLLDEACLFPATTHEQFAQKLYGALKEEPRFKKPKRSTTAFALDHYAGEVTYECDHFIEKNKDFVVADHQKLLAESEESLLRDIFAPEEDEGARARRARVQVGDEVLLHRRGVQDAARRAHGEAQRDGAALHPMHQAQRTQRPERLRERERAAPAAVRRRPGGGAHLVRGVPLAQTRGRVPGPVRFARSGQDEAVHARRGVRGGACHLNDAGLTLWQTGKTKVFLRAGQMASLDMIRHKRVTSAATFIQKMARGRKKKREFDADEARGAVRRQVVARHARASPGGRAPTRTSGDQDAGARAHGAGGAPVQQVQKGCHGDPSRQPRRRGARARARDAARALRGEAASLPARARGSRGFPARARRRHRVPVRVARQGGARARAAAAARGEGGWRAPGGEVRAGEEA
jgi:hypothetical protein